MKKESLHIDRSFCTTSILTKDGQKLSLNIFNPAKPLPFNFIISSDIGLDQSRYFQFCNFLAQQGIRAISFDYRGVGASRLLGAKTSLFQWATHDLDAVILYVKNQYPAGELILLSHGWTGQLIGLAPASLFLNQIILVNSSLSGFNGLSWKAWGRSFLRNFIYYNIPSGILGEWLKWNLLGNGLFELHSERNYRKFRIPILACRYSNGQQKKLKEMRSLLAHFRFIKADIKEFNGKFIQKESRKDQLFSIDDFYNPSWKTIIDWSLSS